MNGLPARGEKWCTARAISSLPVPLSPVIRTGRIRPGYLAGHVDQAAHRRRRDDRRHAEKFFVAGLRVASFGRERLSGPDRKSLIADVIDADRRHFVTFTAKSFP